MKTGFFTDENGILSMARLLAFIFGIATVGAISANIALSKDWKVALVTTVVPAVTSVLCLFLRKFRLGEVADVAKAVKGTK